jgi:hypothetical protein
MAQVVAAAAGGAGAARPLGGPPGTESLRPAARLPFGPRERWTGSVASRGRRDSPVASVISRAPRPDTEVLPVSPDDDAVLKVAACSYLLDWHLSWSLAGELRWILPFGAGVRFCCGLRLLSGTKLAFP